MGGKKVILMIGSLLLASCATTKVPDAVMWKSTNQADIKRAQDLYSCAKFYQVVAAQRDNKEEKDNYYNYSKLARRLAAKITPIDSEISPEDRDKLDRRYDFSAHREVEKWVKLIGENPNGPEFSDLVTSCLKKIQQEEFIYEVEALHPKLVK